MKHRTIQMLTWFAVLSIMVAGDVLAQPTMPSLVTQQSRLSTGGATPVYVQQRAKQGISASTDAYFWDQAPAPTAGVNYTLWLDANNNIVRSTKFGLTSTGGGTGGAFYLERVNATGNGVEWVQPTALVNANNGLSIDSTTNPGTDIVQFGGPTTSPSQLLNDRSIDQAGHTVNFTGADNSAIKFGSGNIYNFTLDVGTAAGGNMTLKNILANNADTLMLTLDGSGNVKTRPLSSLVTADNGLIITGSGAVELGSASTGGANLIRNSFVTLAGKTLNFDGAGSFNVGDGTNAQNITIDPSATGTVKVHNLLASTTATKVLVLGGTDSVLTRDISTLVVADNGLSVNPVGGFVELGAPATGGAKLLVNRFVTLNAQDLTFDGAGNFKVGDGTGVQNITLDPSATGSTNLKNLAPITPAANNRFVVLDGTDKAFTRTLSSFVLANQGVTIDSTTTPGVSTVQLGDVTDGNSQISTTRFIQFTGATPSLTFDGTGTFALGGAGNLQVNIDTKASDMTLQGNNLDNVANANNFLWVDTASNVVHRAKTSALGRDNTPVDYIAIDHTTGNIVRAQSPTAGIFKGHVAWTAWNQTITLPGTETLVAGASITVTIENHNSQGTVAVQVTNVAPGAGGTFDIAAADDPPATPGSFINYVIINP